VLGCFALNGLSYVAVLAALGLMRVEEEQREGSARPSALEGLRYVARTPVALRVLVLFAVTASFGWLYQTLLPALAAERFHRGAAAVGQLTAAAGIGAVLAAAVTAALSREPVRRLLVYGGAFAYSLSLLLFASVRSYPTALATLVLVGFGLIVCGVNINARLQEEVPDALRGRVMAIFSLIWMGFQPLGGLLGGALAQQVGSAAAVRVGAGLCLSAALALFTWSQAERRAPRMDTVRKGSSAGELARSQSA
jgi:predicted MFS family arabinose efflux permease